MIKQGIVIPVYNHGRAVGAVVEKLKPLGLPIILVDDGSDSETKAILDEIHSSCPLTVSAALKKNSGKGRAVIEGLITAEGLGLSHVLQIDADGQHDAQRARFFLEESASHPQALICSYPEYDESIPASRFQGRKIANTWVKIVTLSSDIKESMLGFRVYPIGHILGLYRHAILDWRMGFDVEILVRLNWKNIHMIYHPVKVSYPADGISHFRLLEDNARISWVFTKLCLMMFPRLPVLLARLIRRKRGKK